MQAGSEKRPGMRSWCVQRFPAWTVAPPAPDTNVHTPAHSTSAYTQGR